jgi:hypothetical protein
MDFEATGEKRKMQLSKLEEWREKAYHNSIIYRELKDGMTRKSRRRNLHPKIRYFFLILGLDYLGMESTNQVGRTIYGDKHFIAWSSNSSKQRRYIIQGKWTHLFRT